MKLRQLKLADLLQVQNGFAFKSELFCDTDRGLPLIRIRDLPNSSTEVHYDGPYREEFIVSPGDFLIGMDGDFRCFRWEGPRGLLNQRVCRLQGFVDGVEPDFIYHWIGSKLEAIHNTTAFVTVKHISSKQILNLDISLPPLDEQRRIADILNHAASIRRLREEARAKAREIIPALFVEMFGDPVTNPKGWPVREMGDLFSQKPNYGTMIKPSVENGEGRWLDIRVANIKGDQLDLSDRKYASLPEKDILRHSVADGDLLMARAIGSRDHLGKCVIAMPGEEKWAFDSHLMRVRYDRKQVLPRFIQVLLGTSGGRSLFLEKVRQSAIQFNINVGEFSSIRVPLPPLPLQQEFAEHVAEVEGISTLNDRAATAAEQMARSLLAQVFGQAA